eukprot:9460051-Heterocapsa_arctica.AAC.1
MSSVMRVASSLSIQSSLKLCSLCSDSSWADEDGVAPVAFLAALFASLAIWRWSEGLRRLA